MSAFFSIFASVFFVLVILVMIFNRKHVASVADSEPQPVTVIFNVDAPTSSSECLRIIEAVNDGDMLQLRRESEDESSPAAVLVIASDGSVVGEVEKAYRLSFYTEIDRVMECEAVSVVLGSQLYIKAKAIFQPGSYIAHMNI